MDSTKVGTTTIKVTDIGTSLSLCGQIYKLAPWAVVFYDHLQDTPGGMQVWCMSLREVGMQPSAYSILETLSGIASLGFKIGRGAWGEAVEVDA